MSYKKYTITVDDRAGSVCVACTWPKSQHRLNQEIYLSRIIIQLKRREELESNLKFNLSNISRMGQAKKKKKKIRNINISLQVRLLNRVNDNISAISHYNFHDAKSIPLRESRSNGVIAVTFTRVSYEEGGGDRRNFIGLLSPDWRNDKMFIVRLFRNSRGVIAPSVGIVTIEGAIKKRIRRRTTVHVRASSYKTSIFMKTAIALFI